MLVVCIDLYEVLLKKSSNQSSTPGIPFFYGKQNDKIQYKNGMLIFKRSSYNWVSSVKLKYIYILTVKVWVKVT